MGARMPKQALVLGIGNVLWADEGFGVRCVGAMSQLCSPCCDPRLLVHLTLEPERETGREDYRTLRKLDVPLVPVILGNEMEVNLRRAINIADGDYTVLVSSWLTDPALGHRHHRLRSADGRWKAPQAPDGTCHGAR